MVLEESSDPYHKKITFVPVEEAFETSEGFVRSSAEISDSEGNFVLMVSETEIPGVKELLLLRVSNTISSSKDSAPSPVPSESSTSETHSVPVTKSGETVFLNFLEEDPPREDTTLPEIPDIPKEDSVVSEFSPLEPEKTESLEFHDDVSYSFETPSSLDDYRVSCLPDALKEGTFPTDAFQDIELDDNIPLQFRKDEVRVFSGRVLADPPPEVVVVFYYKKEDPERTNERAFVANVENGRFSVPVFLPETGQYLFSLIAGNSGYAVPQTISVKAPECENRTGTTTIPPLDFETSISDGAGKLSWTDNENNLFHIHFSQGEKEKDFFLMNTDEFSPPLKEFESFSEGEVSVQIRAAKAVGNSLSRTSDWSSSLVKKAELVRHYYRDGSKLENVTVTETAIPGEELKVSGVPSISLSPDLVVIDPDENFHRIPMTITNDYFLGKFPVEKSGIHIVEVNRDDNISVFMGASSPEGSLPLLPDFFDLEKDQSPETRDASQFASIMLDLVNSERSERGISELSYDKNLEGLAEYRANDMCERNYFGHVDPDGKGAGDYAEQFSITNRNIGENIVSGMNIEALHELLMYSAAHRELILNPDFTSVGFGFCRSSQDNQQLIGAEIFGGEKEN